jgi:hypothetical protein
MGKWTAEEDAKLTDAVKKYDKEWVAVAPLVPGRTNNQCRQRWVNYLDPSTKVALPAEEDLNLIEGVQKHAILNCGKDMVAVAPLGSR